MLKGLKSKLEKELQELQRELHHELPREIGQALALGDLRENAEYQMALERQFYVQARIGQLNRRLLDLSTLNLSDIPRDRAALGSTITVLDQDSGVEIVYELVMNDDSDVTKGSISIGSPIGRGLLGRQIGDEIEIRIPSGRKRYEVMDLQTLHDKAQALADSGDPGAGNGGTPGGSGETPGAS